MKRILLLTTILVLYACGIVAQKKSYISVSGGMAVPLGGFANKDLTNNYSGLAGVGQTLNITYQNVATNKVGFAIELSGSRFPVALNTAEKKLNNTPIVDFSLVRTSDKIPTSPQTTYTTYNNWNIKKDSYLSAALLAGVCAEIPAFHSKNIFFNAKVLVGGVRMKLASLEGTANTDSSAVRYAETEGNAFGLTYKVGGALHFRSVKKFYFLTGIDFAGSTVNYREILFSSTQVRGHAGEPNYQAGMLQIASDVQLTTSSVNVIAGVGLRL